MKKHNSKEIYLDRRSKQLHQWEPILEKLMSRADNAKDEAELELRRHVVKIQVKKARTEVKLRQLRNAGKGEWDDLKTGLDNSMKDLRVAFLKTSK